MRHRTLTFPMKLIFLAVRLGRGGLIFTVTSASSDSPEQELPSVQLTVTRTPTCTGSGRSYTNTAKPLRPAAAAGTDEAVCSLPSRIH